MILVVVVYGVVVWTGGDHVVVVCSGGPIGIVVVLTVVSFGVDVEVVVYSHGTHLATGQHLSPSTI